MRGWARQLLVAVGGRRQAVHTLHVPLKVVAPVELVATLSAVEGSHATVDVEVPLQVVLVVLAAEMHSTHGTVIPLQGPITGRHLRL